MADRELTPGEKYLLTITEASEYFGIGKASLRRIAEDNEGDFALYVCGRFMIIRPMFERWLDEQAVKKCSYETEVL